MLNLNIIISLPPLIFVGVLNLNITSKTTFYICGSIQLRHFYVYINFIFVGVLNLDIITFIPPFILVGVLELRHYYIYTTFYMCGSVELRQDLSFHQNSSKFLGRCVWGGGQLIYIDSLYRYVNIQSEFWRRRSSAEFGLVLKIIQV